MNKRIQKKVAKRQAQEREEAQAQAAVAPPGPGRAAVGAAAEQANRSGLMASALGAARAVADAVMEEVQERTTEAIGQAKQKIAAQEERAEAVLERVPVVGERAAKKLHELTHR